jgi:hypothetical protein
MAIVIKKKSGLNHAMQGLREGFQYGVPLGQRTRALNDDRAQVLEHQRLARQRAQQISEQIDRELAETAAAREGVGVLADETFGGGEPVEMPGAQLGGGAPDGVQPVPMPSGPAGGRGAIGGGPRPVPMPNGPPGQRGGMQNPRDRIKQIAMRMDPATARVFLADVKDREIAAAKERGLKDFADRIATIESEGLMKSDPESRMWKTPEELAEYDAELQTGLKNLHSEATLDPDADPVELETKLATLTKNTSKSDGKADYRGQQFMALTEQANQAAAATGGMMPPAQGQKVRTMLKLFKRDPRIADNQEAYAKFQAEFNDATQGYTRVGDQRVRFEDEQTVRKLMMEKAELANRYEQARIQSEQAQARYYDAGAQGRLTPKPMTPSQSGAMTEKDRVELGIKYRTLAQDANPAEAAEYLRRADAIEAGGEAEPVQGGAPVMDGPANALSGIATEELHAKGVEMIREVARTKGAKAAEDLARAIVAEKKRRGLK